ncbi:MAG: bifunctional transaldolase/phosoglucose isomerase [Anaerolineae bacterium]|jgi:transaldolase/glucose-6-phosphate isomerase
MTKLHQLAELGQAIWLDYIRRSFITAGDLDDLVAEGLRGVTSNPSIFEKAIAGSNDYDEDLRALVDQDRPVAEIYEALAIKDIQMAADVLRPVYHETGGADGYVSLEVSPDLAYDTAGSVAEARRLWAVLDRPNVMIKVPATAEGIPAIEKLIGEGINVNVTLMFSLEQYDAVAEAYISGLETLDARDGNLGDVASVASFFVSRVDVKVDRMLDDTGLPEAQALRGTIGIANAKMAYQRFKAAFSGERWERLANRGARLQRPLWASTSTKDPTYPDTLYPDNLVGPHTVNTLPPATLNAYRDHGVVALNLDAEVDEAAAQIEQLADLGIHLDQVTDDLLEEGVEKFVRPFASLMDSIEEKIARLQAQWRRMEAHLGVYQEAVDVALDEMARDDIIDRIWRHDHTVWKPDPEEIVNRLGWLHIARMMQEHVPRLESLVEDVQGDGYSDVLLLGMGGSSLAPEVFSKVFQGQNGLDLAVLDSTDPGAVLAYAEQIDLARTLFIVSSKSGGTAETISFFKFFHNRALEQLGPGRAGEHFVAITDPGSKLAGLGEAFNFRAVFLNDPHIGGRYSALSFFGLLPAALVGVDVPRLLDSALAMASGCEACVVAGENLGGRLGAILGELARAGRDKVTFVTSERIASFGDWVEQLIAESTGKSGTGILPVVGEPLGAPGVYGDDRLFVHLRMEGDDTCDAALEELQAVGYPVVRLNLRDVYDLGEQIFLWEMATAVAGYRLGIHPFNQPNVEAAKIQARRMIAQYQKKGQLPEMASASVTAESLTSFLHQPHAAAPSPHSSRGYIALQAYVQPTLETSAALEALRVRLRDRYRLALTVGYGPRFLHSTGQLHKGDAGNGLFVQFMSRTPSDVAIPDEPGEPTGNSASSITFGVLKMAQALGDRQALEEAGRRVITFQLGTDVVEGLKDLTRSLE